MFAHQALGYSEVSPQNALASALGAAIMESHGAADTHIVVTGIIKTGKGWKATVNVICEPRAKMKNLLGAKLVTPSPDTRPQRKKAKTGSERIHLDEDENEKKRAEAKEKHLKRLDEEYALEQEIEQDIKEVAEQQEHGFILLYMEILYEDIFREISHQFEFTSVHFLEGALWEEAKRHAPDIDFYEAVQANNNYTVEEPSQRLNLKPSKNYQLTEDLKDE